MARSGAFFSAFFYFRAYGLKKGAGMYGVCKKNSNGRIQMVVLKEKGTKKFAF